MESSSWGGGGTVLGNIGPLRVGTKSYSGLPPQLAAQGLTSIKDSENSF